MRECGNTSEVHRRPTALRGRVVVGDEVLDDGVVVTDGPTLAWVGPWAGLAEAPADARAAAAQLAPTDHVLLPGLVDLHCHGGGGASFPDARDAEDALVAIGEHRRHGTTTLVASLVTAAPDALRHQVALLADLADAGKIAGIHLEGPFLSARRCGAQDPGLIQAPDPMLVTDLLRLGRGHLATMTLAPELPGNNAADGVAARLIAAGALPSWGHTDADAAITRDAVRAAAGWLRETPGRRSARATVTHLFNGMRPWRHRDAGPIGEFLAAARRGDLVVELIGDGTHVSPDVVREVVEIVGRDAVLLVTDAMAAAGMPDGDYRLGSMHVVVADGIARLRQGGAIAGGTAHLLDVVRTTVGGGVSLTDAVHMAAAVPARVLGLTDRGELRAGLRADVVVTGPDLGVRQVLRAGAPV
jgi:N-acetylglucosamine-6-phosphate deacetylase